MIRYQHENAYWLCTYHVCMHLPVSRPTLKRFVYVCLITFNDSLVYTVLVTLLRWNVLCGSTYELPSTIDLMQSASSRFETCSVICSPETKANNIVVVVVVVVAVFGYYYYYKYLPFHFIIVDTLFDSVSLITFAYDLAPKTHMLLYMNTSISNVKWSLY